MNVDTNQTVLQEDDINRLEKLYGMFEPDATEDLSAITDESSTIDFDVPPYPQTLIHTTWDKTLMIQNILQLRRLRRSRHTKLPARYGASFSNPNVDITIQNIVIL